MTEAKAAPRRDRFPILLAAAVVVVLLAVGAAGLRSWRDLAGQRAREAELEGALARTEADVRRLEERIERLQDDPLTLERLARHDLGMVRPEDVVFVFPEELSGKLAPRSRPAPQSARPALGSPAPPAASAPAAAATPPAPQGAAPSPEASEPMSGPTPGAPAGTAQALPQEPPSAAGATASAPAAPTPSARGTAPPAAQPDATPPSAPAAAPS